MTDTIKYTSQFFQEYPILKNYDETPQDNSLSFDQIKKMHPSVIALVIDHAIKNKTNNPSAPQNITEWKTRLGLDDQKTQKLCNSLWLRWADHAKLIKCPSKGGTAELDIVNNIDGNIPESFRDLLIMALNAVEKIGPAPGKVNPFTSNFWNNLPHEKKINIIVGTTPFLTELFKKDLNFDISKFINRDFNAGTIVIPLPNNSYSFFVVIAVDKLDLKNASNFFAEVIAIYAHELYGNVLAHLTGKIENRKSGEINAFKEGIRVLEIQLKNFIAQSIPDQTLKAQFIISLKNQIAKEKKHLEFWEKEGIVPSIFPIK